MFGDITMTYFVPARWVALWALSAGMFFMLAKQTIGLEAKWNCESQ